MTSLVYSCLQFPPWHPMVPLALPGVTPRVELGVSSEHQLGLTQRVCVSVCVLCVCVTIPPQESSDLSLTPHSAHSTRPLLKTQKLTGHAGHGGTKPSQIGYDAPCQRVTNMPIHSDAMHGHQKEQSTATRGHSTGSPESGHHGEAGPQWHQGESTDRKYVGQTDPQTQALLVTAKGISRG